MRKKYGYDALVLALLLLLAGGLFLLGRGGIRKTQSGGYVLLTVDRTEYGVYALSEDRDIPVRSAYGENTVRIRNGAVSVVEASCRDRICVHTGAVSRNGESIVCLPNRLVVRVLSKEEGEYDTIAY